MPKLIVALSLLSVAFGVTVNTGHAQDADPFLTALSLRHGGATLESLEEIAGSREAVVARLLEARHLEKPPFAGIAAQKLLLQLADRSDVQDAIDQDIASPEYFGLARIVVVHLDKVPNAEARSRFARTALSRVEREPKFRAYARTLVESSDSEVSRLAREALEQ